VTASFALAVGHTNLAPAAAVIARGPDYSDMSGGVCFVKTPTPIDEGGLQTAPLLTKCLLSHMFRDTLSL